MKGLLGYLVSLVLGLLGLLTLAASPARAGTLDCDRAAGAVALAVCADDTLTELDRHLAASLAGARAALGEGGNGTGGAACLAEDQARWETEVRNPCGGSAYCLRRVYLDRLAALDGLQPEASRVTAFDLPEVAVLVTALPPEPEDQAAGSQVVGGPYALMGQLMHEREDAQNMGLAIRTLTGRSTVLVPDMDIGNSPAHAALESAIRSGSKATYRVEGRMNPATGGFALNQCRFVYRLAGE